VSTGTTWAVAGSTLFFAAKDATHGTELWKSNGTSSSTVIVKDINLAGDSSPERFAAVGSKLVFVAADGHHGAEPWESDGSAAGTTLMKDVYPGSASSAPTNLAEPVYAAIGGAYLFTATDGAHPDYLWRAAP
jgi:ELWxxDGT repeat protein